MTTNEERTENGGAVDEGRTGNGGPTDDTPPALRTDEIGFDPVEFLAEAVRTPSHETVEGMRELLCAALDDHDIEASVVAGGCVLAEKSSSAPAAGPHLVLNTHIDTVRPHVPFERGFGDGTDEDEPIIRGRGACDAKGPLAALLYGFLAAEPERGRLTLAITPDEEVLSLGAAALMGLLPDDGDRAGAEGWSGGADRPGADRLDGDLFLVGEPTGLDVCTAAKGRFQGTVDLHGEAAHAAEFAGANAVAAAEGALRAIRTFDDDAEAHPQLGEPKLTPTLVEGGSASNQVPADCAITVDRRSVPPETADGFRDALTEAVRAETPADVDVAVELTERESPFFEAFATDPDHEFVGTVANAAGEGVAAVGVPSDRGGDVRPFGAATEASYFAPAATVVFGPGDLADETGPVAHAEREYVRIREVEAAALAVERAIDRTLSS